jgi:hypothetical protein
MKLTIDLGKTSKPACSEDVMEHKPSESEQAKVYPRVYISDIKGIEDCPEEFYLKCRCVSLTKREVKRASEDAAASCSIEAECLEMIVDVPAKKERSWMDTFDDVEVV